MVTARTKKKETPEDGLNGQNNEYKVTQDQSE